MKRNFDYTCTNFRGFELAKCLNLYIICDRRDNFLTMLMFKANYGIAPNYLSGRIDMHINIHDYDTREVFLYLCGKLWNDLPDFVKNSTNIEILEVITEFT